MFATWDKANVSSTATDKEMNYSTRLSNFSKVTPFCSKATHCPPHPTGPFSPAA